MARSSKPDRCPRADFQLALTHGGQAHLTDLAAGELVWSSAEDEEFEEEFGGAFLQYEDVADVLDYLEEIGELTEHDADTCEIREEFLTPAEYAGLLLVAKMRS